MVTVNQFEMNKINNKVSYLDTYLKSYINEFLQEKKNHSIDTYRNYLSDFNNVFRDLFGYSSYEYLTVNDLKGLTIDKLIKYKNSLINDLDEYGERNYSNATINRRISSFKSLMKYLRIRGVRFNFYEDLKILTALPNRSKEIDPIPMEDALKILDYFKQRKNGLQLYLASKLSIDTGLRAKEILTLTWGQFYPNENTVIVKSKGDIKGKGNKDWEKEISHSLYNELLQLKQEDKKRVFNISYSTVAKAVNEAVKELGFQDKEYSFHSFRKCAATNHYELTKDLLATQNYLNHKSPETTQRYVAKRNQKTLGVFSISDSIDKELYKKVDKETLIEVIEELKMEYLINMKLNEKIK